MIKGNALSVFTIALDNGHRWTFVARDEEHARSLALYHFPGSSIVSIKCLDDD
jgi:hypothetical protein